MLNLFLKVNYDGYLNIKNDNYKNEYTLFIKFLGSFDK